MKPFTAQQFPTHKHTRNHSASITAKIARLVLAVVVALAQPIHAQNASPDPQQVRTELGKVVADLRTALAQLARIEAEAATLPKTFTAGGPTQTRWNLLNADKERWTAEQGKALERFDQLVTQSKALPPGNAAVAELLTLCNQLIARNDAAIKAAQTKLSGIEGTLRRGPSTFAKGSQIEVWQTQLNREKDYWTGNLATLGKEHEKLAAQLATLKAQSNRAKVVAGATEPAKMTPPEPSKVASTTEPPKLMAPAPIAADKSDKTIETIDQIEKAIKTGQQYTKEGNIVEAVIQYDRAKKLAKTVKGFDGHDERNWISNVYIVIQNLDSEKPDSDTIATILKRLAGYRAYYPTAKAKFEKERALEIAIAARRKEEADKDAAERRKMEENAKTATNLQEAAAAASVSDKPPYDFTFGHLPFGLEKEDVVRLLEKRPEMDKAILLKGVVGSNLYGDIDAIGHTCATGLFTSRHLPPRTTSYLSFHPNLTANVSYILPGAASDSKEKAHLGGYSFHFYRTSPISKQYFLFAASKQYNSETVELKDYSSSFGSVRTLLTKEIGSESVAVDYATRKDKELKGALWELPDYWVWIVMEKTTHASIFANGATTARDFWTIGYIHKPGLTKYLHSNESAKAPNQDDFDIVNVMVLLRMSGKTDEEISADAERMLRSVRATRQKEGGNNP